MCVSLILRTRRLRRLLVDMVDMKVWLMSNTYNFLRGFVSIPLILVRPIYRFNNSISLEVSSFVIFVPISLKIFKFPKYYVSNLLIEESAMLRYSQCSKFLSSIYSTESKRLP